MGPDPMDEGLPHDMNGVTAAVDLQQENVNLKTRLAQVKKEMEQRKLNSIIRTWILGSTSSSLRIDSEAKFVTQLYTVPRDCIHARLSRLLHDTRPW